VVPKAGVLGRCARRARPFRAGRFAVRRAKRRSASVGADRDGVPTTGAGCLGSSTPSRRRLGCLHRPERAGGRVRRLRGANGPAVRALARLASRG
jgi:hypothetical protein